MSGETKADRSPLGGLIRRKVIRDIALSGMTQQAIGEKYNVSQPAISQFAGRYAEEIEAVRQDAANEFAGILIADKQNRVAALQDIYEAAMELRPVHDARTGRIMVGNDGLPVVESDGKLAATVLKQAAEEMGQLASRVQMSGDMTTTTTYRIEGVDPSDLT